VQSKAEKKPEMQIGGWGADARVEGNLGLHDSARLAAVPAPLAVHHVDELASALLSPWMGRLRLMIHQVSVTLLKPLGASGLSPLSKARSWASI
jgi:hypothetical protein